MRFANPVLRNGRILKLFVLGIGLLLTEGARLAWADMLFFKDGFAVEGRVQRQMKIEFDRVAHDAYYLPDGFFYLNDGARRIFFSPSQVRYVFEKDPPSEERILRKNPLPGQVNPKKLPPFLEVISAPNWDDTWSRRFQFRTLGWDRPVNVPQHISVLTPYWAQADSLGRYFWGCAYLTRELGPDTVQALLASHPDFQEKTSEDSTKRASIRLRKADFFAQAGWLDLADKELDRLLTDLPDQKERVETARKTLWKLRASDRIEEIKRRHLAGQHRRVAKLLEDFSTRGATNEQIAKVEELTHDYKQTQELIEETARLLAKARRVAQGADSALLRDAADIIHRELNFENVARLDAFLGQARQEERLQKEGKKAVSNADQLLSLAVSGWLLGSAAAETSRETGQRLWRGREMVLSYLRTDDEDKRRQMLQQHLAGSRTESASLDELAQIIRALPPISAEKTLPDGAAEQKTEGAGYVVQLPPEYRHSRRYPVLIVLHQAGEKPRDMLDKWKESAAENGYLVVAPEWQTGANGNYTYSEGEHAVVLNTLKDVRRRFNADEDRVFLFGMGEGGNMAFDVGLGHPDLFAGVLPMAAGPQYHAEICWRNAQKLPFYVVHGAQGPDGDKVKDLFKNWVILRHYPSLWIDYKGRGAEWFGGELPNMFDWMRGQRRRFELSDLRQVGSSGGGNQFGNEFCTQRHCDNHFYWLSCEIDDRYVKALENWRLRLRVPPAALDARIDFQNNAIHVHTTGIRQVTVWLGRNSKGEDMIDFDKPVNVYRNNGLDRPPNRKVKKSLEVMLEDFAQRGDRQLLFLAKIELGKPQSGVPAQRVGTPRRR